MILPDLAKRIAWYQERLRPEDERFGVGIADWTITCEYLNGAELQRRTGETIWGCMCSPSALPELMKLTHEDVAARRAHIVVRVPEKADDMIEIDRTILHELGHVLVAPLKLPRDAEEEIMHSLDHLFSKLTPEEGIALARAIRDPMARAFRAPAKEGDMPDDKDKKEPDKTAAQEGSEKDKPAMQEGASIEEIEKALVAAKLAGDDAKVAELMNAWIAAKVASASAPEPASAPPQMGVEQQDAYARAKRDAQTEAVTVFVDNLDGVPDDRKAYLRKRGTIAEVKEALAFLPKGGALMGFDAHPATRAAKDANDEPESVFYPSGNKDTQAAFRVMARKKDGVSARGVHKCSPQEMRDTGHLMRFSLTEALPHLREVAEENARRDRKTALGRIGGEQ